MNKDFKRMSGDDILANAQSMSARIRWDNLHDEEDAAQDAALAMVVAAKRARDGLPIRHYQRSSGKGAILNFYNANQKRRAHEFLTLTKRIPSDDGTVEFIDRLPNESGQSHAERLDTTEKDIALNALLDTLPEKESAVIRLRFFESLTLADAGRELNLTAERVRQVEELALASIRHKWEMAEK